MPDREIITFNGKSREDKIASVKRIKEEFERELPELAALRESLVALGMMDPGFKAIRAVRTESIDYHVTRDDPGHDERNWAKPPIENEEIIHEREQLQARKSEEARATRHLFDTRSSAGRRARILAGGGVSGAGGKARHPR